MKLLFCFLLVFVFQTVLSASNAVCCRNNKATSPVHIVAANAAHRYKFTAADIHPLFILICHFSNSNTYP